MHLPENFAHSFIVRVRLEEAANSIRQASWRGQIEHIPGGERHYFKEPDEISSIILSYLEEPSAISIDSDRGAAVSSLFPFLDREPVAEDDGVTETPSMTVIPDETEPVFAAAAELMAITASPQEAITNMLSRLREFLPGHDDSDPLPSPDVSVAAVSELPLAIGNLRGMDRRGTFTVAALKGGRLDTTVHFQLWAHDPGAVNSAMDTLHSALLAAKDELWLEGFLRISVERSSPAEHFPSLNGWRKSADYRILYEFHNVDNEGAESIIARIPIDINTDTSTDFTLVTDEMMRWDNESTGILVVRGRHTVGLLSALASLPGPAPENEIILARTTANFPGELTEFDELADFLTAVTDPVAPDRHARVVFQGLDEFLAEFTAVGNPIVLGAILPPPPGETEPDVRGDWNEDGVPDMYQAGVVKFDPPIHLPDPADQLQLICQDGPFAEKSAVVYFQARSG
jgi:hypothetical protein